MARNFGPSMAAVIEVEQMGIDYAKSTRRGEGGKPATMRKMTKEEFAAGLKAADLTPEEFALIWNTEPRRVNAWLDGTDNIPFPIAWALPLLERPDAFFEMHRIVEDRATFKPHFVNRGPIMAAIERLKMAIEPAKLEAMRWSMEHPSEVHPQQKLFERYDVILGSSGMMNIQRQMEALIQITKDLGLKI